MIHHFIIEFGRVTGDGPEPFDDHLERIADILHADGSVTDVSIGANLANGTVEFEAGADAHSSADAVKIVLVAVVRAIQAGGGRVDEAFHLGDPSQLAAVGPQMTPQIFESEPLERWSQRKIELTGR